MKKDYYKILGLKENATKEQIKRAYRKLAFNVHPDFNKDSDSQAKFAELTEAYEALASEQTHQTENHQHQVSYETNGSTPSVQLDVVLDEILKTTPKSSVPHSQRVNSESGINGGASLHSHSKKPKGTAPVDLSKYDIHGEIYISKEEALNGTSRELELQQRGSFETKVIEVRIPPHTKSGHVIKIQHEGLPSPFGENGSLFITVKIEKSEQDERVSSRDAHGQLYETQIHLPYSALLLGGLIRIETPVGVESIQIPKLSYPGMVLTIPEKGHEHPKTKARSDMRLKLLLNPIQHELKEEQIRALEMLRALGL